MTDALTPAELTDTDRTGGGAIALSPVAFAIQDKFGVQANDMVVLAGYALDAGLAHHDAINATSYLGKKVVTPDSVKATYTLLAVAKSAAAAASAWADISAVVTLGCRPGVDSDAEFNRLRKKILKHKEQARHGANELIRRKQFRDMESGEGVAT